MIKTTFFTEKGYFCQALAGLPWLKPDWLSQVSTSIGTISKRERLNRDERSGEERRPTFGRVRVILS